jgi:hypothetical protein
MHVVHRDGTRAPPVPDPETCLEHATTLAPTNGEIHVLDLRQAVKKTPLPAWSRIQPIRTVPRWRPE